MVRNLILVVALTISCLTGFSQIKKVLFVMSSAKELKLTNGKTYPETGVFLSEFYLAYKDIRSIGYEIDFATPDGLASSIDKESLKPKYWSGRDSLIEEAQNFISHDPEFTNPNTLENVMENLDQYSGIVIPGGQGLMVDLIKDKKVAEILMAFSQKGKAIGLICHAPALILSIPEDQNPFIGYKVNSVTGLEELFIENFVMKGRPENRRIARQLKAMGLQYTKGGAGKSFAVRDRELITSQNPYSNDLFSKYYTEALKKYELRGTLK